MLAVGADDVVGLAQRLDAARGGAFIEIIGHYDPRTSPETVVIKEDKAIQWLSKGAQPTATTARLLGKAGILEKFRPVKEKS